MIGAKQLVLGAQEIIAGQGATDYSTDGALSNSNTGINPFLVPGEMYRTFLSSDLNNNIAGNFIASCEDTNAVSPNNRYFIDDAANYYSYNGTAITKVKTGAATTKYVPGKSDFISFNGTFYATLTDKLASWDGSTTLNESFQSLGDGIAHHPMLVFEGFLWVGDGNTLSTLNSSGTYSTSVLTLSPKEKIVALGIDPGTGLMLISVQTVYDVSDIIPSLKAIYLYDGYSSKPRRKILVDDLVTAFYNVGGTVYVGAGLTVGYWNGSGVSFLRKLVNITNDNTQLPYKHHFGNYRNVLLVADGFTLMAYGEVLPGKRAWYNIGYSVDTNNITCVAPVGANQVGIGFYWSGTAYFLRVFDFSAFSTTSGVALTFAPINFPRPVFIRMIRVFTTPITTNTDASAIRFTDEHGTVFAPAGTTPFAVSAAASPRRVFDFFFGDPKVQTMTLDVFPYVNQKVGFRQAIVYYDPAE